MQPLPTTLGLDEVAHKDPFLGSLLRFLAPSHPGDIYLVGGYLRDYFLGDVSEDIDFMTFADPEKVASDVASHARGRSFALSSEDKAYRVVVDDGGMRRTVDFAPVREGSVEGDISLRDFTINAMALDVERLVEEGTLRLPRDVIDKHYGWQDLSRRILRECHDKSFLMDPVRLVRALRFRHVLGLEYEERTLNHMKKYAPLVTRVPGERIAVELLETLLFKDTSSIFSELEATGLLQYLFSDLTEMVGLEQNAYHHLDVWSHTLLTLEELDRLLAGPEVLYADHAVEIDERMKETVQDLFPRSCFMRLAALYHDVGKVEAFTRNGAGRIHFHTHQRHSEEAVSRLAERLKLSRKAGDYVQRTVGKHMDIALSVKERMSAREIRKLVNRLGDELIDVVLLSTADRCATRGPLSTREEFDLYVGVCRRLLDEYCREAETPPLIRGRDLVSELDLPEGPVVGEILKEVRMAQLEGAVSSREEALDFARDVLRSRAG